MSTALNLRGADRHGRRLRHVLDRRDRRLDLHGDAAHNEFVAGTTYTDTFTVAAADGTLTSVTVNILGTNDAAVLSADVRDLTETNTAAAISTGGTLTNDDVDSAETFVAQTGTAGAFGTFSIDTAGAWTYTADTAHDEFVAGTTYTDTFSVAAADGTLTSVTVNILAPTTRRCCRPRRSNLTETDSGRDQHRRDADQHDVDSAETSWRRPARPALTARSRSTRTAPGATRRTRPTTSSLPGRPIPTRSRWRRRRHADLGDGEYPGHQRRGGAVVCDGQPDRDRMRR